ncbi:MAG: site-2 protease family protein [Planctomycetota bacterium]
MFQFSDPLFWKSMLVRVPVVLVALSFHEFSHAFAAFKCGDDTAKYNGRLTLNPLAHLDPIGTLCLMFAPIGWAKPVPVNPMNFRNPRKDDIKVSLAGPGSNFLLAIASFILLKLLLVTFAEPVPVLVMMLYISLIINFALMLFNLLPLFPLDGSHVVQNMLKYPHSEAFARFSQKAPLVLMGIIFFDFFILSNTLGFSILGTIFRFPSEFMLNNFLSSKETQIFNIAYLKFLGRI